MPKYINAENLSKKLGSFVEYDDDGEQEINSDVVFITIYEMPSADVRENIHGEWIYDIDGIDWGIGCWKCSICKAPNENIHEKNNFYANPLRWAGSNFCPNCGADMRGDKND